MIRLVQALSIVKPSCLGLLASGVLESLDIPLSLSFYGWRCSAALTSCDIMMHAFHRPLRWQALVGVYSFAATGCVCVCVLCVYGCTMGRYAWVGDGLASLVFDSIQIGGLAWCYSQFSISIAQPGVSGWLSLPCPALCFWTPVLQPEWPLAVPEIASWPLVKSWSVCRLPVTVGLLFPCTLGTWKRRPRVMHDPSPLFSSPLFAAATGPTVVRVVLRFTHDRGGAASSGMLLRAVPRHAAGC